MSAHLFVPTLLAWLALTALSSAALRCAWPWLRPRVDRAAVDGRLGRLTLVCWLPILAGTALTLGCYSPSALSMFGWSTDHCELHGDHHIHLCVAHIRASSAGPLGWALLAGVTAWIAGALLEVVGGLRRGATVARSLRALATQTTVEAAVPLSLTAGLFFPRVYVTSALREQLSEVQLDAVLAHERCHVRERHGLVKLVATLGALVLGERMRSELVRAVALCCERRSDEAAATAVGDRLEVAVVLLATRRALAGLPLHGVLSLAELDGLEARVRALSHGSPPENKSEPWALALVLLASVVALGHEIHHGVETLLSLLLA